MLYMADTQAWFKFYLIEELILIRQVVLDILHYTGLHCEATKKLSNCYLIEELTLIREVKKERLHCTRLQSTVTKAP